MKSSPFDGRKPYLFLLLLTLQRHSESFYTGVRSTRIRYNKYKTTRDNDTDSQIPDKNILDRSLQESEQMALRRSTRDKVIRKSVTKKFPSVESRFEDWGAQQISSFTPHFPNSMSSVAEAAFQAISSTLYGKNYLDPNIVNNALAVSVLDTRPLGFAYSPPGRDVGRLGIELDGTRYLMTEGSIDGNEYSTEKYESKHELSCGDSGLSIMNDMLLVDKEESRETIEKESRALRRFSLVLASKLGNATWVGLEESDYETANAKARPVAIFYSTVKQALFASKELQLLRQISKLENGDSSMYDHIQILCLGQDDIPKEMTHDTRTNGRRPWGSSRQVNAGKVNPNKGIILIVQPTDFNHEVQPPSPAVNAVTQLQVLLARASVVQIPAVVISPRLTEQWLSGIEQSGYQKSSTYGGIEPPKGPTPWILRDFIPPVFSWIGNALELPQQRPNISSIQHLYDNSVDISLLSRAVITQTVMDEGHPWHIFVAEDCYSTNGEHGKQFKKLKKNHTKFLYMASTRSRSGRPTRQIINDIVTKWL